MPSTLPSSVIFRWLLRGFFLPVSGSLTSRSSTPGIKLNRMARLGGIGIARGSGTRGLAIGYPLLSVTLAAGRRALDAGMSRGWRDAGNLEIVERRAGALH